MKYREESFNGVGNIEIYYQNWSPDLNSRGVIALVHGMGEHSGRYMNVVNYFVPLGYTVYGFDHRGHGKSQGKRGHVMSWSEFRQDVGTYIQIIKTECAGQPVFLMGHSLGGLVVLDYSLHHPEGIRAVIASSPALSKPGIPGILLFISKIMSKIWPGLTVKTKLKIEAISRDPEVIRDYKNDPLVHSMASARLGTEFNNCREATLAKANEFSLPLLIYHGKEDCIVPPQGSREFYEAMTTEDRELHLFDGGYHEPHNDIDKDKVFIIINEWIKNHI